MKFFLLFVSLFMVISVLTTTRRRAKFFRISIQIDDLPNGLRVVTVPTDYPNLVSLYTVVGAGSRNEIEARKAVTRIFSSI